LDEYQLVEDANGAHLASDDASGEGINARLHFLPKTSGLYRLIATTFREGETGRYTLTVRERIGLAGQK